MKKKLSLFLSIITILSTIIISRPITVSASTVEIRTTIARTYYDLWELNNKPGYYRGKNGVELKAGDTEEYNFLHEFYRGLAPGEKVVGIKSIRQTKNNLTEEEFNKSMYEYQTDVDWKKYNESEDLYGNLGAVTTVLESFNNTKAKLTVKMTVPTKDRLYDISETNTDPDDPSKGYRTYVTVLVEWEIEKPTTEPKPDPKVIVQHRNKSTDTKMENDKEHTVTLNSTFTESSKTYPNMVYLNSVVSDDEGKTYEYWFRKSSEPLTGAHY